MEPKTLEEALQVIAQLQEKVKTVIDEKKEVLKMFDKETLDGMTDTERKLAEALEESRQQYATLEKSIADKAEADAKASAERTAKLLDERIAKVAKGDKDFEAKLRANIDLLEKMPRTTDSELDAIVDSAYKLTGQKEANPLNEAGGGSNNPHIDPNAPSFATTEAGKGLASRLGMVVEAPKSGDQQ